MKVASPAASVTSVPSVPAFGPLMTLKVTVAPSVGSSFWMTVAVRVCGSPRGFVASSGVRRMSLMTSRPSPLARM